MFDIGFFMETFDLKEKIIGRQFNASDCEKIFPLFEQKRNVIPYLFSIETTNACNMACVMCPRTEKMTRKIENMKKKDFEEVAEQVSPHRREMFEKWSDFVKQTLKINPREEGENPFYFYVSSRSVTMHGFGEPLLDPQLTDRIRILSKKWIPTYFSCNPSNIKLKQIEDLFEAGLTYIKFSIDSLSDEKMKEIRGRHADYKNASEKILQVLDLKMKKKYHTVVIVCMIKISMEQDEEAEEFLEIWKDRDVYAYVKSLDNRWHFGNEDGEKAKSHYESQYCEFPWTSLSVMCDGTVVPCTQDFNCEMPMGHVGDMTLKDIWNGDMYRKFRMMHITGKFPKSYRCKERCDLKTVSDYIV
jgi:radical SAM protein with 4Fe4S-binding SPASM domain